MKAHTTGLKGRGGRRKPYATMVREAQNGILPTARDLADERLTELGQRVMLALLVRQARMAAGPRELKELALVVRCTPDHLSRVLHGRAKVTDLLNDLLSVALPEARIERIASKEPPQLRRAHVAMRAKRIAHRLRLREEEAREKRFLRDEVERAELVRWAEETGHPEALIGLPPLEVPPRIAEARAYVGRAEDVPAREYAPEVKAQVEERLARRAEEKAAAEDLRRWRMEEARISYADAAALSGLTLRQIRFLELGDRRVKPETRPHLEAFVARWRAERAEHASARAQRDPSAPAPSDASPAPPPAPGPAAHPQPAFQLVPPPGSASGASS